MYKRTNNAETFRARVANHSTKGSRRGFVDVHTGINPADELTPAQQRDSLQRRLKSLQGRREQVRKSKSGKDEYFHIGQEIQEVQNQMSEINKQFTESQKGKRTFDWHFATCARKLLPTQDFERISEAARRSMMEESAANPLTYTQ